MRVAVAVLAVLGGTSAGPFAADGAPGPDSEFAYVAYAVRPGLNMRALAGFFAVSNSALANIALPTLSVSYAVPEAVPPVASEPPPSAAPAALDVVTGTVRLGHSVSQVLVENGVAKQQIRQIEQAIHSAFDLKNAAAGDSFLLTRNEEGQLVSFQLQHGRSDVFQVSPAEGGRLSVAHSEAPVERRVTRIGGVVKKSLTQALLDQGERVELLERFADIFLWQIDFAQESQPGDEYRLIFEKYYDSQGFVRYGKILAAQYVTPEVDLTAVYYEGQNGQGDYFTPAGRSLRRSFLRAPVRFTRISSGFAKMRLHPLLNKPMPHEAIDYAAPVGTPVWAVADGKVTIKAWRGGLGRSVGVEHANGCITYYGHLSRYGDVEIGDRVRQKRVIGYVGKSGLATGPHVDFRMRCAGRLIDPSRFAARAEEGSPIRMEELFAFEKLRKSRLGELRGTDSPLMLEAGM